MRRVDVISFSASRLRRPIERCLRCGGSSGLSVR